MKGVFFKGDKMIDLFALKWPQEVYNFISHFLPNKNCRYQANTTYIIETGSTI